MSLMSLPPSSSEPPLRAEWVEALFAKLAARYGTLFTDRFAGVPHNVLVSEWASELAGFAGEEIRRGLDGCRDLKFPPTLPEFLALCRPPIEPHTAYAEAMQNMAQRDRGENPAWSHPAIYWAAAQITYWELRQSTYSAIRLRWERALSDQLRRRAWEPIPVARVSLPAPPASKGCPEDVRRVLRELTSKMRVT